MIDAPRVECDRSAHIQETFSSFTQSYSIMIGGDGGVRWCGLEVEDGAHRESGEGGGGVLWNRRIIEL